jgi:tetratricopeptide (TPR) repeat protein
MKIITYCFALYLTVTFLSCGQGKEQEAPENNQDSAATAPAATAALADLEEKVRQDPNNSLYLHELSKAYIAEKRFEEALQNINKAILLDSTNAAFYLTMADLSFAANRTYNAKQSLEKALQLDPSNIEAMLRLAELNLIVRKHSESVELLNKVLELDNKNTTAWFMRGINFKENGDTNRAVRDFQSAIEADPEFYNAYMQLGMIFQLRNDPASEGYFTNAIRVKPGSEEALYGRGLWYQDHNQLDKAIQDYTTIIQMNPQNKNAHFNLGYIHQIHLNIFPEAIKHYTRAIEADPRYAEAFYNRGLCYEAVGNLDAAQGDFRSALMIRPVYPVAEQGLNRVKK